MDSRELSHRGAARLHQGTIWMIVLAIIVAAVTIPLALADASTKTVLLLGDSLMAESHTAAADYLEFRGYTVQSATLAGAAFSTPRWTGSITPAN